MGGEKTFLKESNFMYLYLSADLHLTNQLENTERYTALEHTLTLMQSTGQEKLIIAGDLFDASFHNYSEFETVCKKFSGIHFYIIPGNHDPEISSRQIVAPNVTIFSRPEVLRLDPGGPPFLFLPYEKNKTMGECIAEFAPQLPPDHWVLVAHGDYLDGLREANPYEDGLYMPLTRKDLATFRPAKVFLGHIHVPMDKDPVYYTGSPCGLDITETGLRRYIIYDTQTGVVESRQVDTDVLFYDETLTILPLEDETAYLRQKAQAVIQGWGLASADYGKVRLRLKVNGFSTDRETLLRVVNECFHDFSFYNNERPDISTVSSSNDPDRSQVAEMVRDRIKTQTLLTGRDDPVPDEIILAALETIYGGK